MRGRDVGRAAGVGAIRFYQRWISAYLAPSCRFTPSCSEYAAEAVERHGLVPGGWLAVRRLLRCHPFHPGGYDPVPPVAGAGLQDAQIRRSDAPGRPPAGNASLGAGPCPADLRPASERRTVSGRPKVA